MFYYISGKLAKLDGAFAVVDAGGIGIIADRGTQDSCDPL